MADKKADLAGPGIGDYGELEKILDRIQKKGGLEFRITTGEKHYCTAPLVVGMYEFQLERLTPEFIKDFKAYTSDRHFGIEFLSTELPQMRTIPVAESILPQHDASTFDEVTILLEQAQGPFVIIECICRKKKRLEALNSFAGCFCHAASFLWGWIFGWVGSLCKSVGG